MFTYEARIHGHIDKTVQRNFLYKKKNKYYFFLMMCKSV